VSHPAELRLEREPSLLKRQNRRMVTKATRSDIRPFAGPLESVDHGYVVLSVGRNDGKHYLVRGKTMTLAEARALRDRCCEGRENSPKTLRPAGRWYAIARLEVMAGEVTEW
jgi:hypothetical protein